MFKKTLVVRALAVAFGAVTLSMSVAPIAYGQSNATGTIFGSAEAGTTITIESVATNAKRSATVDANGRFQFTALPPGRYKVQAVKDAKAVSSTEVEVLLGQGVEATLAAGPTTLQAVQVVGSRQVIDVSSTNGGSTFTARELAALPIAQNITSIMQLAPDVVKADPRYAGGASVGGGAPSENSYYINGFPVTNPLTQLGSMELPFGAIQQAQILTGGFGAEFGRSTGGVVNITTKSGSNKFEGGGYYSIAPNSLRAREKNILYDSGGNPGTDGKLFKYNQDNSSTEQSLGAYVGGPIIQDKLFFFIAADQTTTRSSGNSTDPNQLLGNAESSTVGQNGWTEAKDVNKRYLAKFDWNITDNHRLELTALGDNWITDASYSGFDYTTLQRFGATSYTAHYKNQGGLTPRVGGEGQIIKYTGNLTSDLTLQALYGQSSSSHEQTYNPNLGNGIPGAIFVGGDTSKFPGLDYGTSQPLSGQNLNAPGGKDKTKSFRLDVEYTLGSHTLRAGLDENKLTSASAGLQSAGGSVFSYRKTATPDGTRTFGPYTYVVNDGSGPIAAAGYYVRQRTFSSVTDARSDQTAQYIEDRWQVNNKLLLTLGLRNESFKGYNQDNEVYINSKNFVSPRIGAALDVNGDSSLKLFGNLGRYSIQTPTHVAVRGAGKSTLVDQFFTYTGVDANGVPTGLKPLTAQPFSPDGETGLPKDPNSVAAQNPKPAYQDELILGIEKALTPKLTAGAKMTYRKLGATLDDTCDERPFDKYADDHGINRDNYAFNCLQFNPGRSNDFLVDYAGTKTYTPVTLSAADMGYGDTKPKRTFLALDFFLEHPFSDGWYGKLAYTWSKSKGNTEGQTKSDNGQTDVSATSTWDFPELMVNTYGYLPSDRRHQIKAIGYWQFLPEWGVGGNFAASSGRPRNCNGNPPDGGDPGGYGSVYFFCSFDGGATIVPTPRDSQGRLPWNITLDANLVYQPSYVKGLKLRVDVFNLFNRQSALARLETHEPSGDSSTVLTTYGSVVSYSAPRYVKLTAQYDF
jgi:Carboxypeptidase regulatory-like domain/TonB dependent receptor/TonB-dependent Receptor Plug Domain